MFTIKKSIETSFDDRNLALNDLQNEYIQIETAVQHLVIQYRQDLFLVSHTLL